MELIIGYVILLDGPKMSQVFFDTLKYDCNFD
jgi:hypothetical protein